MAKHIEYKTIYVKRKPLMVETVYDILELEIKTIERNDPTLVFKKIGERIDNPDGSNRYEIIFTRLQTIRYRINYFEKRKHICNDFFVLALHWINAKIRRYYDIKITPGIFAKPTGLINPIKTK